MTKNMSRLLVETVVRNALKSIRNDPERGVRNLIDMALQFSEGRFQKNFFTIAQSMLQNEKSAYYDLIRNTVLHTDIERLYTFGMNLGYNGCTEGARQIRSYEETMNCNIPWSLSLQTEPGALEEHREQYDTLIHDGEQLGIFTWMLFPTCCAQSVLPLVKAHPDSAFCLFCEGSDLTDAFLDEAEDLYHTMLVVRYDKKNASRITALQDRELLYSVWYSYGQRDMEVILNEDLFFNAQELTPMFTVLLPGETCPKELRRLVYQAVTRARREQTYQTILLELQQDSQTIDSIISGDGCSIYFNKDGYLCDWETNSGRAQDNLFQSRLPDILSHACPNEAKQLI